MSRGLRLALALCVLATLAIGGAAVASAHAQYASSTPPANASLSAAPTSLAITFTEELASIQISVTGPHGSEVTTGKAAIDLAHRTNASVPLKDDGPGTYMVAWKNVSGDDGDPNDGAFVFTVAGAAPAAATPTPAPAAAPGAPTPTPAPTAATCPATDPVTPGISDVRLNTYCKRQAIRDKYRGQIDELTFNFDVADGVGLDNALAQAMEAKKGH
jgi:methionine-rich copper-binding protein CopC